MTMPDELRETHISRVVLRGDRAYKLKKPVRLPFVDCVEFDPTLREIDVGFDLAFLLMDLMRASERLAAVLVAAYRDAGGDPGDDDLVALFARAPDSAYTPEFDRRTYAELGRRARERVAAGEHVVVDATFRLPAERAAFLDPLGSGEPTRIVCQAPAAVLARRAAARQREPGRVSDAGPEIARLHAEQWQPLAEPHVVGRTDRSIAELVVPLRDALDARLRTSR